MPEKVITNEKNFDAWYQDTLGPLEKQLGVEGKEDVRKHFESKGFVFRGDTDGKTEPAQSA